MSHLFQRLAAIATGVQVPELLPILRPAAVIPVHPLEVNGDDWAPALQRSAAEPAGPHPAAPVIQVMPEREPSAPPQPVFVHTPAPPANRPPVDPVAPATPGARTAAAPPAESTIRIHENIVAPETPPVFINRHEAFTAITQQTLRQTVIQSPPAPVPAGSPRSPEPQLIQVPPPAPPSPRLEIRPAVPNPAPVQQRQPILQFRPAERLAPPPEPDPIRIVIDRIEIRSVPPSAAPPPSPPVRRPTPGPSLDDFLRRPAGSGS